MTLRITRGRREGSRSTAKVRLEGNIAAEWAALLEMECNLLLKSATAVILDLAGVVFVDCAGVEALRRLSRAGVEIRCLAGPVASVLEGEGIRVVRDAGTERLDRTWQAADRTPASDGKEVATQSNDNNSQQ